MSFQKLDAVYVPIEIDESHFEKMAPQLRFFLKGYNVTLPYKSRIMTYLDKVDADAQTIGAVNTVYLKSGKMIGANTDYIGFLESLKLDYREQIKGKQTLVLGAGGTARAVLYALNQENAGHLIIVNRTTEKAEQLKKNLKLNPSTQIIDMQDKIYLKKAIASANLVINTTSMGLGNDGMSFFDFKALAPNTFVYDVVYTETPFLKKSRKQGCRIGCGQGMLVRQGYHAFKKWFNKKPDLDRMFMNAGFMG